MNLIKYIDAETGKWSVVDTLQLNNNNVFVWENIDGNVEIVKDESSFRKMMISKHYKFPAQERTTGNLVALRKPCIYRVVRGYKSYFDIPVWRNIGVHYDCETLRTNMEQLFPSTYWFEEHVRIVSSVCSRGYIFQAKVDIFEQKRLSAQLKGSEFEVTQERLNDPMSIKMESNAWIEALTDGGNAMKFKSLLMQNIPVPSNEQLIEFKKKAITSEHCYNAFKHAILAGAPIITTNTLRNVLLAKQWKTYVYMINYATELESTKFYVTMADEDIDPAPVEVLDYVREHYGKSSVLHRELASHADCKCGGNDGYIRTALNRDQIYKQLTPHVLRHRDSRIEARYNLKDMFNHGHYEVATYLLNHGVQFKNLGKLWKKEVLETASNVLTIERFHYLHRQNIKPTIKHFWEWIAYRKDHYILDWGHSVGYDIYSQAFLKKCKDEYVLPHNQGEFDWLEEKIIKNE